MVHPINEYELLRDTPTHEKNGEEVHYHIIAYSLI